MVMLNGYPKFKRQFEDSLYFQHSRSKDTPRASLGMHINLLQDLNHATIIDKDKSDNDSELGLEQIDM